MHIYLAETTNQEFASFAGALVVLVFILGILVVGCTCVVMAFKRRTVGWVISGSVSGIVIFILLAGVVGGVIENLMFKRKVYGFVAKTQKPTQDGFSQPTITPLPPAPASMQTQLITGKDVKYTLRTPVEWTVKRQTLGFDAIAQSKSVSVGIIAEEANVGSPENVATFAIQHIKQSATNVMVAESIYITLDGRKWIRSSIDCNQNGIPIRYIMYLYSGAEGSYQLVAWGVPNLVEKYSTPVETIIHSFEFPK